MWNRLLFIVSVCCWIQRSFSVYFLVDNVNRRCFNFEQPKGMSVIFAYNKLDENDDIDFELFYGARVNPSLQNMHRALAGPSGKIPFEVDNDGYYTYCVRQNPPLSRPTRLSLKLLYGHDDEYYTKLATEENFDDLNVEVRKINDAMNMILNEADYQKHKEVEYHEQTERMNLAALYWPLFQILILLVTGIFQVRHLKYFFKTNKGYSITQLDTQSHVAPYFRTLLKIMKYLHDENLYVEVSDVATVEAEQ